MKFTGWIILFIAVLGFVALPGTVMAQRFTSGVTSRLHGKVDKSDENAQLAYEALKSGKLEDARNYLDDANAENPYAMFVRAALTQDGAAAADLYKEIVAENEGTPIAREALIQLYRYHYAAGEYAAAERDYIELQKFPLPPPVPDPIGLQDSLQSGQAFHVADERPPAQASPSVPSVPTPSAHQTTYLVQVGVFTTADNARRYVQDLKVYGVHGRVFKKDIGGRTFYGVSAGAFSDRSAAEEMAKNLKSRSVNCIVVEK